MSFFNSEFVQQELKEISTLQEEIYEKMYALPPCSSGGMGG
jgi:hypothetical protein